MLNAASSATPPTTGGSTIGSSTRPRSRLRAGTSVRARTHAKGVPKTTDRPAAAREHRMESRSALRACSDDRSDQIDDQSARCTMPTRGSAKNATAHAAATATSSGVRRRTRLRSEEHTSELQSLMRNSYAVFCLKKKKKK